MTETTASDDNPLRRLGNAGLALPLLVGVTMSLLCFVLAARYSAGDVHAYVSGAEALFCGGAIDPTSLYHQRIGMLLGAGLTMAPFDWALWSVVIFPALTAGATAGLIVVACRMWLPSLPAHIGALLPFCMQGLITKGATLAPDVPQAAAFSASLLLLFQPEYKLPSKCCAFLAGTLFALMLTFNQAGGRLGAVIVVLGVWWYWKVPGHRRRLIVLAATAGGGLLFGMVLTGLV
ncbi:MAG: hypothetical protein L6Q71_05960, partial [Planctomycetes bacterium]|nr:hypothetical protein [Planctomycetota bacterium]